MKGKEKGATRREVREKEVREVTVCVWWVCEEGGGGCQRDRTGWEEAADRNIAPRQVPGDVRLSAALATKLLTHDFEMSGEFTRLSSSPVTPLCEFQPRRDPPCSYFSGQGDCWN